LKSVARAIKCGDAHPTGCAIRVRAFRYREKIIDADGPIPQPCGAVADTSTSTGRLMIAVLAAGGRGGDLIRTRTAKPRPRQIGGQHMGGHRR